MLLFDIDATQGLNLTRGFASNKLDKNITLILIIIVVVLVSLIK